MKHSCLLWICLAVAVLLPSSVSAAGETEAAFEARKVSPQRTGTVEPPLSSSGAGHCDLQSPDTILENADSETPHPLVRQFECFKTQEIAAAVGEADLNAALVEDVRRHHAALTGEDDSFLFRAFVRMASLMDALYYLLTGGRLGYAGDPLSLKSLFYLFWWVVVATLLSGIVQVVKSLKR